MIAGCYDLHLYCDGADCTAGEYGYPADAEFTGDETGSRARARARRRGWKLFPDGRCLCPACRRLITHRTTPALVPTPPRPRSGIARFAESVERATTKKKRSPRSARA